MIKSWGQHHLSWGIPQPILTKTTRKITSIKSTTTITTTKKYQQKEYWQKKSTMTTLITAWQTTSILIVGMKATTKIT